MSAIKTFPALSTVIPLGFSKRLAGRVVCGPKPVAVRGTSTTRLLPLSAMNTSPALSTATPTGLLKPLNGRVLCAPVKVTLCPRAAIGERHNRTPPTSASGFWKIVVTTRNQGRGCSFIVLPREGLIIRNSEAESMVNLASICQDIFMWSVLSK